MNSDGRCFVDENDVERRMIPDEIVEFLLFGNVIFTPKRYNMRIVPTRTPTIIEIDEPL